MQPEEIIQGSAYAMAAGFVALLPRLGIALCFLLLIWALVRVLAAVVRRVLRRTRMRRALIDLMVEVQAVALWIVALFVSAGITFPSVTPASIMTGLGLGTVAIGFAFRDIFENFLAGILILYREPFRLGDCIECAGIEGFVEEVTARDTHLRQTDGQRVVLPNAMLFKNQVTVRTDRDIRRTTIFCRVGLTADLDRAREVMTRALDGLPSVVAGQAVQVFAHRFGDDHVEFEVTWWTGPKPVDIRRSRDEVIAAVKRGLDGGGIPIAVPRRAVTVVEPEPGRVDGQAPAGPRGPAASYAAGRSSLT